jgi:two-component system chemotaxis sensor kinase CheA
MPLIQVQEILQVKGNEIQKIVGGGEYFTVRDQVIPLFSLNKKLGHQRKSASTETVLLIKHAENYMGIIIDDVNNKQQIVIKKLGDDLEGRLGLIGGTILGDGHAAFILDLIELFKNDIKKKNYQRQQLAA